MSWDSLENRANFGLPGAYVPQWINQQMCNLLSDTDTDMIESRQCWGSCFLPIGGPGKTSLMRWHLSRELNEAMQVSGGRYLSGSGTSKYKGPVTEPAWQQAQGRATLRMRVLFLYLRRWHEEWLNSVFLLHLDSVLGKIHAQGLGIFYLGWSVMVLYKRWNLNWVIIYQLTVVVQLQTVPKFNGLK